MICAKHITDLFILEIAPPHAVSNKNGSISFRMETIEDNL